MSDKSNCRHLCEHENGVLWLFNDDDSYYSEAFESRQALNEFIARLQACADECWPEV